MKKEFSFSLFDLDWEVFGVNIEGAINRVPAIEKTGIKSTVCGPGTSIISVPYTASYSSQNHRLRIYLFIIMHRKNTSNA